MRRGFTPLQVLHASTPHHTTVGVHRVMCQRKIKKQKLVTGFTLIETIIYTGLVVLVLASVVLATQTAIQLRGRARAELTLGEGMRFALTQITDRVRTANNITFPTIIGTASETLTLDLGNAAENPTTFTRTGDALTITEGTGMPVALTAPNIIITALSFTRLEGTPTPISLMISGTIGSGTSAATLTLTAIAVPHR